MSWVGGGAQLGRRTGVTIELDGIVGEEKSRHVGRGPLEKISEEELEITTIVNIINIVNIVNIVNIARNVSIVTITLKF